MYYAPSDFQPHDHFFSVTTEICSDPPPAIYPTEAAFGSLHGDFAPVSPSCVPLKCCLSLTISFSITSFMFKNFMSVFITTDVSKHEKKTKAMY